SKVDQDPVTSSTITADRFQYQYRLGCTITKTTSFSLNHHPTGDSVFEIFTDNSINYDVEEIIEEKLIEEDEENLKKSTLESINESIDSIGSTNSEASGHDGSIIDDS